MNMGRTNDGRFINRYCLSRIDVFPTWHAEYSSSQVIKISYATYHNNKRRHIESNYQMPAFPRMKSSENRESRTASVTYRRKEREKKREEREGGMKEGERDGKRVSV